MSDAYDRLETRAAAARESALLRDLAHVLAVSKSRAPALRTQLRGIDVGSLRGRADLAAIPVRRRDDLLASQAEAPPFGGFAASRIAAMAQVFALPGRPYAPAGRAKDWWGLARGLHAAGLAKGELVLNACSYDLSPEGHMVEAGARAIGCPVIPAGQAAADIVAAVAARLRPTFACATAERLQEILDCGVETRARPTCLERALVIGRLRPALRAEFARRGVAARQALLLPEVGLIAFESGTGEGLTLAEGLLLEIVEPGTGRPVASGSEGEMVLSRVNLDYPLLRYATGLVTRVLPELSTCGRTNSRIAVPHAAPDRRACGNPMPIDEIRRRHPDLTMRLSGGRADDAFHLAVEHGGENRGQEVLREALGETLRSVTRRRGTVEIVTPGSLRDEATGPDEVFGA